MSPSRDYQNRPSNSTRFYRLSCVSSKYGNYSWLNSYPSRTPLKHPHIHTHTHIRIYTCSWIKTPPHVLHNAAQVTAPTPGIRAPCAPPPSRARYHRPTIRGAARGNRDCSTSTTRYPSRPSRKSTVTEIVDDATLLLGVQISFFCFLSDAKRFFSIFTLCLLLYLHTRPHTSRRGLRA
ncbi:hypothetical protein ABB37_06046 [Leptomonas pyrrhocoris]|uniref:Uncharacterized protein n=1 Tax=Leptomonas pyrrhocoris TaxID=157538 RepID=A0A0N0VEV2_LEPPY|nr:hypothetical protein ABB37_06046 [Leptomonas pyrrhocoris]KPA78982.1 hypothetical protein ABB37_06046 [Leptomonas pyrrhocoris]|eukprot:XP_015657421.1 hypothetical protein ABB37_06046 [Leptomonas pyrrhocoris]